MGISLPLIFLFFKVKQPHMFKGSHYTAGKPCKKYKSVKPCCLGTLQDSSEIPIDLNSVRSGLCNVKKNPVILTIKNAHC